MKRSAVFLSFGLALVACAVQAEPFCPPTLKVDTVNYPGAAAIPPTNNLMLPTGKSVPIEGQTVVISGRVLDSRCIPVREAIVEIWQTDPFGKWFLAEKDELANPNPVFAGAGRAVTDALGQFTFTTAFPGSLTLRPARGVTQQRAPHVNLRIKAKGFSTFSTVLFFENDRRNALDPVYKKITPMAQRGVTMAVSPGADNTLDARIDLVLRGKAPYQTY